MTRYVVRRLLLMVPILFGLSLVSFGIVRLAPGDPALLVTDLAGNHLDLPPDVRTLIGTQYRAVKSNHDHVRDMRNAAV